MSCFCSFDPAEERQGRSSGSRSCCADLKGLSFEEKVSKARYKVLRMVSASEQSSVKVRSKLINAGFDDEVISSVVAWAVDMGAIDDKRYSECLIRSAIASGKGLERVRSEIEALGIELSSLDAYRRYEEAGEEFYIASAIEYLSSHPPRSRNIHDGAYRKLISRGYHASIASRASRAYVKMIASDNMCFDIAL